MNRTLHAVAGGVALAAIVTFWTMTVAVEIRGDPALIARAKAAVLAGMAVLVPALMATGASGVSLAKRWRGGTVEVKKTRMMIAAANGLVVLVPSAILLALWSAAGRFDGWFVAVQGLELTAGAANAVLIGLNMRDGLRMRRRRLARGAVLPT